MKKIITVLSVVCLCMAIPAQAELKWGVKGGLNVSELSIDGDLHSSKNKPGFFIGPMMEFNIPATGLGIDASLLYSQQTLRLDESDSENEIKEKRQGVEIPINLKYTFGLGSTAGIYIAAGPDLFFDFSKENDAYYPYLIKKDVSIGINVGAGVKLIKKLQIGINYTIPLGNSGEVNYTSIQHGDSYFWCLTPLIDANKYKTRNWQASVAYLF